MLWPTTEAISSSWKMNGGRRPERDGYMNDYKNLQESIKARQEIHCQDVQRLRAYC